MILKKGVRLTKIELAIMDAFWRLGVASVREIQDTFQSKKRPAYTTIQTVVYRLEEKGALRKVKKVGNAYVFEPAVTRDATHRRLIDDLLDVLDGSTRPLMAHLVDSGRLSLDDLKEIEDGLRERAGQKPAGDKAASGGGKSGARE
ncbi:MAG TPA: BlaI/MecI/CopY family transcriptional regulator [Pyrinomonadaceae bacterium]